MNCSPSWNRESFSPALAAGRLKATDQLSAAFKFLFSDMAQCFFWFHWPPGSENTKNPHSNQEHGFSQIRRRLNFHF